MMHDGKAFFLTTAIDYPNSRPHIGTAFEKIGADVQARFRRMEGDAVHFLMGNDENTIKVSQRAEELGVEPKPYVDDMARQFREVWGALEISNDDFIQTSEPRHHAGCRKFIQAVHDAGDIEKRAYTGLYCDGCEAFKTEKDLVDGRCPNHPKLALRAIEEENYFFLLSRYRDRLLAHYDAHPDFIQPESRRNEIVNLVTSGLQDVAITPQGVHLGHPRPVRPRADDLRLVRCAPELHHGDRLRRGRGPLPVALAGRRPRHRQGHHPVPLRPLAGHADVGGPPAAEAGLRARLRLQQGGQDQQVGRHGDRPDGRLPRPRRRRLPLLLHEGVPLRRRRQLQRRAVRRGLQRRPGQQPGQPLQPDPVDVRQVLRRPARRLRRRRPRSPGVPASTSRRWCPTCAGSSGRSSTTSRCNASGSRCSTPPTATSRRPSPSSWPRPTPRPARPS